EGITEQEYEQEIVKVKAALRSLPSFENVQRHLALAIEAGERIADISACWDVSSASERQQMVYLLLRQGGLIWSHDEQCILGICPHEEFLPSFMIALPDWKRYGSWLCLESVSLPTWL